jgi:hypothetical protein
MFIKMKNNPPQDRDPALEYKYSYDCFINILKEKGEEGRIKDENRLKYPMVSSIFLEESSLIKVDWIKQVATLILRIHSNQTMYDVAISEKTFASLLLIFDFRFSRTILNILVRGI